MSDCFDHAGDAGAQPLGMHYSSSHSRESDEDDDEVIPMHDQVGDRVEIDVGIGIPLPCIVMAINQSQVLLRAKLTGEHWIYNKIGTAAH